MKISKAEIAAALVGYYINNTAANSVFKADMRRALEAAYTVRKQRKAAKRERQRKEKDKQVVESVKPVFGKLDGECFAGFCEGGDKSFAAKHYTYQAPEWNSSISAAVKPKPTEGERS